MKEVAETISDELRAELEGIRRQLLAQVAVIERRLGIKPPRKKVVGAHHAPVIQSPCAEALNRSHIPTE